MVYRYVRDNGHRLTIYINLMIKYVCYMGVRSNNCFMANVALTDSHYKMDIISGVSHTRSNLVVPLVLYTMAYNIRDIGVVLQVS
jgi:hypothetical protein